MSLKEAVEFSSRVGDPYFKTVDQARRIIISRDSGVPLESVRDTDVYGSLKNDLGSMAKGLRGVVSGILSGW